MSSGDRGPERRWPSCRDFPMRGHSGEHRPRCVQSIAERETHQRLGADRLTEAQLEFLRSWPTTISMDGILFCHGSPQRDTDRITIETPADRISEWCEGAKEQTIVCGHTHVQFKRQIDGRTIVNPGSVGNILWQPWRLLGGIGLGLRATVHLLRHIGCRPAGA